MAWPATVNAGDTATAGQYNALVAALKTWGGNVDGGNYALTNVSNISAGSGGITTTGTLHGIYQPATATVVGGVKQGASVTIAADGTLNILVKVNGVLVGG